VRRLGSKLTYANVVATLALVIAVGGASALAATHLAQNSVGPRQLRKTSRSSRWILQKNNSRPGA